RPRQTRPADQRTDGLSQTAASELARRRERGENRRRARRRGLCAWCGTPMRARLQLPYSASLRPETDDAQQPPCGRKPCRDHRDGAAATQNACAIATTKLAAPACRDGMPDLTIAMP